jgi:hypothetical protein
MPPNPQAVLRRQQGIVLALVALEASIGVYLANDGSTIGTFLLLPGSAAARLLLAVAVVAGIVAVGPGIPLGRLKLETMLLGLLVGLLAFDVAIPLRNEPSPYVWIVAGLAAVGLASVAVGSRRPGRGLRIGLAIAIVTGVAAHVATVLLVPLIWDVGAIGEAAGRALLAGENPYLTHVWHGGYPYLPVSAVASAIGILLGDVRWPSVIANAATVVLLVVAGRRLDVPERGLQVAAIWIWTTGLLFVTSQAFYDPLMVAMSAGSLVVLLASPRRAWLAGVLIGIAASTKQFGLGLIPYLPVRTPGAPVAALAAVITVVLLIAPFAAWGLSPFANGTALSLVGEPPRAFALNVLILPDSRTMINMPVYVALALAAAASIWAARQSSGRRWSDSIARWLAGSATLFLVAFALNGIGFVNYYMLVIGLWLMLVLVADRRPAAPAQRTTSTET